jgi:hypothetical protein
MIYPACSMLLKGINPRIDQSCTFQKIYSVGKVKLQKKHKFSRKPLKKLISGFTPEVIYKIRKSIT